MSRLSEMAKDSDFGFVGLWVIWAISAIDGSLPDTNVSNVPNVD
jgi:hypothetical protein